MVEQTSLKAWLSIQDSLGDMQLKVLNVLRKSESPMSHFQIAQSLNLYPNNITGRINELVRMGYVVHDGFVYNVTGKKAKAWRITNDSC